MSNHLHVSIALVCRVQKKDLRRSGVDPLAVESTYPEVAIGRDSNDKEFYLWAKGTKRFIASSDRDERNSGSPILSLPSIIVECERAAPERGAEALNAFCTEHALPHGRPMWAVIREWK